MGNIRVLDKDVVSKIAAGEVIENPSSVVKELVENAIDAGARKVEVEVREGGKSYIRVADDGSGMDEDDAALSIERHSTSKLKGANDLFNISSLGFRGEALASIAAVAELKIETKTKNSLVGTQVVVKGNEINVGEIGCPKGTVVTVKNLFYNTPARKKYLKSIEKELSSVIDIVTRYALGFPEISFKLTHNTKPLLVAPGTTNTLSNIANIYGRHLAKQLLAVNYSDSNVTITGFISRPESTKLNRGYQSIFVNRRFVSNEIISDALNSSYKAIVTTKRYPVAVLNVSVEAKSVDVNVHPSKREIKLGQETLVYDAVFSAVKTTLLEHNLIPKVKHAPKQAILITKKEIHKKSGEEKPSYIAKTEQVLLKEDVEEVGSERLPNLWVIGQLLNTFILAEGFDGLYLIDQHVAVERVNYERFMKQVAEKNIQSQVLLSPLVVELDAKLHSVAVANLALLERLGFAVEDFGRNTIVVRSVPAAIQSSDKQLVLDIIDELEKAKGLVEAEVEKRIIMKACKASLKANQQLSRPQMVKILKELAETKFPYACPHGRPVLIKLTKAEIERRFIRKVN